MEILGLFSILVFIFIYFFPSIIANKQERDNLGAIFILNLLAGWTFIGWLAALIWAMTKDENKVPINHNQPADLSDELKKLSGLKDQGILTEDQFEEAKQKLLNK